MLCRVLSVKEMEMKSVELSSPSVSKNKPYPRGFQSSRIQIGTDQGKEKGEQTVNDEMQFRRSDLTMQFCTNLYYSGLSSWCGFATISDFLGISIRESSGSKIVYEFDLLTDGE